MKAIKALWNGFKVWLDFEKELSKLLKLKPKVEFKNPQFIHYRDSESLPHFYACDDVFMYVDRSTADEFRVTCPDCQKYLRKRNKMKKENYKVVKASRTITKGPHWKIVGPGLLTGATIHESKIKAQCVSIDLECAFIAGAKFTVSELMEDLNQKLEAK